MAQNELALQFFQLGFFRPEMERQALACLDMMDFDGKEQVLQKVQSGAQQLRWQQQALMLAGRYEPELYAQLAASSAAEPGASAGAVRVSRMTQQEEPRQVQKARQQAAQAGQPE